MSTSDDDAYRWGDPDDNHSDHGFRVCPECDQPTEDWDPDAEMCAECASESHWAEDSNDQGHYPRQPRMEDL